jgi:protein-tyrosine phosphatase
MLGVALMGLLACGASFLPPSTATAPASVGEDGGVTCQPGRPILSSDVVNARDLGGIAVGAGQAVACGVLFRGPPLVQLEDTVCADCVDLGIRTIVDLRIETERSAIPNAACLDQFANTVSAPLPIPYNVSAADYIADLDATPSIATLFGVLGDASAYPVYFHCTWGRDRTGIVAAVVLLALGAARADIMADYLLSQVAVGAYPDSLQATLDEIDRRGGLEAYLSAAGVTAPQLATLRARAIAP